ncbi:hypothetical protein [Proteus terrae]|uniref:hypothetical protein n=1 Tax=Proteus terrae TaxID=1574161 RepID=UPI00298D5CA3|nr:hypothetical protein [Proteus terrae]WPC99863.1 hypothetical protein R5P25_04875 [Proteus terrae]
MSILLNPEKKAHRLKPVPLGEQGERYNEDLPMTELDFLDTVEENQCRLINTDLRRRDGFAFPGFLAGVVIFIMSLYYFINFISKGYDYFKNDLELYKFKYKELLEDPEQISKVPSYVIDYFTPFFYYDNFTLIDYFLNYFNGYMSGTPYYDAFFFSVMFLSSFLAIVVGAYQSFFLKPRSLVFNRELNLVYTWHHNKIYVARYPEIGVGKIRQSLALQLFGFDDKKQQLITELFFPNVYVLSVYGTSTEYHDLRFMNFINTYMREGRDALISTNYYRKKPKLYFGKNPLPADFEQQVSRILVEIDKKKVKNA